jgi:putative DNA primase/helicase
MDTVEFLKKIFQYTETGYTQIFTLPFAQARAIPVTSLSQVPGAIKAAGQKNIYFSPGICGQAKDSKLSEPDIIGIPALWVDMDIYHPIAHKEKNLPKTIEEAYTLIPDFLPPTIIVYSGYGLQFWWLLKECWMFDTTEEKERAKNLLTRLQGYIRQQAQANGWKLDAVQDLCRVMRLTGTLNIKIPEKPVLAQVIEQSDIYYDPSEIEELLPAMEQTAAAGGQPRDNSFERRPTDGPAAFMLANCKFLQHWQINYKTLPEPVWMAACTNLIRGIGGGDMVIEAAKNWLGSKYSESATFKKIQHWIEECHPTTCQFIQNELQFTGCDACGVQSPCAWSLGKIHQALAKVRTITIPAPDTVFQPETLGALAVIEKQFPAEYAKFKEKCRSRINLNDLNKCLKQFRKEASGLEVIDGGGGALQAGQKLGDVTTRQYVPDTPLDLAIPAGFTYGPAGIEEIKRSGDSDMRYLAAGAPVIISERIYNMDAKTEKIELTFKYFNQWASVIRKRSEVFSARNIVSLTDFGLNTSSESAKYLVKYLQKLEAANPDAIPLRYAVSKIGWREHSLTDFVIPNTSSYRIDMEDEGEITEAFRVRGDFEEWKKIAVEIRKQPFARFVLAAAFAAPLLKIFRNRNFMIYFWGTSGGGKTASQMFSLTVWGSPNKLMKSFYGTQNGIEKALAFSNDFPTVINEKQVMNGRDKQELFEQIVYMLEGGRGKIRASKNGIQKTSTWRSIGMASGEEPLSKENSIQGVKTRLLELNVYPVVANDQFAKSLYAVAEEHHGHAGPAFMERLIGEAENNYDEIGKARQALVAVLKKQFPEHFSVHIDNVALVAIADYLSSMWIFGNDPKQAEQEAYQLAYTIMQELPTERQISDVERGWDFVQNWLAANDGRFKQPYNDVKITPVFGFKKDDYTCVYPEYLIKALQDAGFSPDKLMREFANKGRIVTETDGAKRRFKILVRHEGRRIRVIKIRDETQETLL